MGFTLVHKPLLLSTFSDAVQHGVTMHCVPDGCSDGGVEQGWEPTWAGVRAMASAGCSQL